MATNAQIQKAYAKGCDDAAKGKKPNAMQFGRFAREMKEAYLLGYRDTKEVKRGSA